MTNGTQLGLAIDYAVQPHPGGLAQAFLIGRDFIGDGDAALILGDNIFHGDGLSELLQRVAGRNEGATIFGYHVKDPERYGVATRAKTHLANRHNGRAVPTSTSVGPRARQLQP